MTRPTTLQQAAKQNLTEKKHKLALTTTPAEVRRAEKSIALATSKLLCDHVNTVSKSYTVLGRLQVTTQCCDCKISALNLP